MDLNFFQFVRISPLGQGYDKWRNLRLRIAKNRFRLASMASKPALSSTVIDQILFAMEDQENHTVFNLDSFSVETLQEENLVAEARIVALPSWSSSDGFRMMREFAESLHNPAVQDELHDVLDSGQGVFRRFKQVLKPRDFLYRQWLRFKRGFMEDVVLEWFDEHPLEFGPNARDMAAGLEKTSLLATDFTCQLVSKVDGERLAQWYHEAGREEAAVLFGDDRAEDWAWFFARETSWREGDQLWLALSPDGDWAGVLWSRTWSSPETLSGIGSPGAVEILLWFVERSYRGLGLGSLLLQSSLQSLSPGQPVFLSSPQGGQRVEGVLVRSGFVNRGKLWASTP